jgi:hypothetical protein
MYKKKIIFFIFLSLNISSFSEELFLNCEILEEIENNKPAKKRLFLGKPIKLFFNKENWLNDISKKEWQENENENIELIQFELIKNRHTYSFELNKFQNIKKTTKESDMKILLNNKNGEMSFVKNYYTYEGKIFFSTVVKGICK